MGIDGGGSTLRVVIADADLNRKAYIERKETSNPSSVGRELAAKLIASAVESALQYAYLRPDDIVAVGAGIAGADPYRTGTWLDGVLRRMFPSSVVVPSSDYEIALVGARGERSGVLLLAGTGSIGYGVNMDGDAARVGGWGYVLGDEGSGYWFGLQALQAVTRADDGRSGRTQLTGSVLGHTRCETPRELVAWLYGNWASRPKAVAALAPLVMGAALDGDRVARAIVDTGANYLYQHYAVLCERLHMSQPPLAFAGGLLESDTPLRAALMLRLDIQNPPVKRHEPVIGATILARDTARKETES